MAYFEMFIDLFFIVDIMINFRTGYLETGLSGTKEILDPRKVARAYLRGWFCIDLLSSIPLSVVEVFMPQLDDSLRAIKFLRFYKLTRLLKLSKLIKVGWFRTLQPCARIQTHTHTCAHPHHTHAYPHAHTHTPAHRLERWPRCWTTG